MKTRAGLLAASAVALLAGCGTTTAPSASHTAAPAATQSSTPPSCRQQYKTWKTGPARALAKQIVPALKKVEQAGNMQDIPKLNSALKHTGHIAGQLTTYPMPACADPKGYWTQMLGYLQAAGDNAGTSNGLAGLMMAMAPLEKIKAVESKLGAELKKTARVS